DSAFRGTSRRREQSKARDTPCPATAGKTADHTDFEGLQLLLAPLHAAAADADTGCPIDRIALRDHALRKPGHISRELGGSRIPDHRPHTRIGISGNGFAIDHHDLNTGWLRGQRTHHRGSHLPRATYDQDAKPHVGSFSERAGARYPIAVSLW